jgi:trigger factor
MQIRTENTGALTATICIELEKQDYTGQVEEKLKEYRRKMKMPGFREGRIPMGMVNKMYGKAVLAEEINKIISDALSNYLEEENIRTIASPLPNREKQEMIDFDTQESFSFWFDIGLHPEVDPDPESLEGMVLYQIEPEEEKTKEYLDHILKRYGKLENTEQVDASSLIRCDITRLNESGEAADADNPINNIISIEKIADETIRNQFIGATVGTVVVMNPMDAFGGNEAELSSLLSIKREYLPEHTGDYSFTIDTIKSLVPATISEELMQEVFPSDNITTEEEFLARIRQDITASYAREAEYKLTNEALEAIRKKHPVELPDEFLKRWIADNDEEGKFTPEELEAGYQEYSEHLRVNVLRNSLISKYNLFISDDDYYTYVMTALNLPTDGDEGDQMRRRETVKGIVENIRKDKKQNEKILDRIMEQKITAMILEKVTYETRSISSSGFDKLLTEDSAAQPQNFEDHE